MTVQIPQNIGWAPFPGGQVQYLSCPVREIFLEGNRGGGKTELLLVRYLSSVGLYADAWRGIIFRREYKHLDDLVAKSKRLFRKLNIKAKWLSSKGDYKWVFDTGEELLFRAMKDPEEYWNYHGHEYPFIAWEELTNYPDDQCYEKMKSCNRCSVPGVPRYYHSTGNPFGAGHGWVKQRFIDLGPSGTIFRETKQSSIGGKTVVLERVRIHVDLEDNKALLEADPEYVMQLDSIENPALRAAWRKGDWEITVGGFLQGIWDYDTHVVDDFEIPKDWTRWRAMDMGFSKPYSVGWYCRDPKTKDVYRYRELYGWGGKPNTGTRESPEEIARKIIEMEREERKQGIVFRKNPADTSLWGATSIKIAGREITQAELMNKTYDDFGVGIGWIPANKGPGSRLNGARLVMQLLKRTRDGRPGGFKVFRSCKHFTRTVPILMPDPDNWEDVDCWAGDTRISTPVGQKRIDMMEVGDLVNTPIGPRRILRTYLSGTAQLVRVILSNGRELKGTVHHKIYVKSSGLVPLGMLVCGSELEDQSWHTESSGIAGLTITVMRIARTIARVVVSCEKGARRFIGKCGLITLGQSRQGTAYITGTMTPITIASTILSAYQHESTRSTTTPIGKTSQENSRHGRLPMAVSWFSRITRNSCESELEKRHCRADIVALLLLRDILTRNIAVIVETSAVLWLRKLVRYVGLNLRQNQTIRKRLRPVHVVAVGLCEEKTQVYNITVADAHLFYAEGVLSSNTEMEDHVYDEWRYAVSSRQMDADKVIKAETGPKPGTFDWLCQYGAEEKVEKSIYRRR